MELADRAADLSLARKPYVLATVVRVNRPTSAKPGDRALVLADGTLEGFIGGTCAESTVRLQGLLVLETGRSTLLRLIPGDDLGTEEEGLVVIHNPCLSGGTLEIFLEAVIPAPLIHVFGDSPIARALEQVGRAAGYAVSTGESLHEDTSAVIVASHGRDEEAPLAAALSAGVPYIALVASRKRGDAVLAEIGAGREKVRTPAGLDIGAKSAPEVAVSIIAQIISLRPKAATSSNVDPVGVAIDPICHMEVAMTPDAIQAERDGQTYYFCGPGCKTAFLN